MIGKTRIITENSYCQILHLRNMIAIQEFKRISNCPTKLQKIGVTLADIEFNFYQRILVGLLSDDRIIRSLALTYFGTGKLWFPLPKKWHELAESQGFNLNKKISHLMWIIAMTSISAKSMIVGLKLLSKLGSSFTTANVQDQLVIYIPGATQLQLNKKSSNYHGYNFINWLSENLYFDQKIHILHSVAIPDYTYEPNSSLSQSFLGNFEKSIFKEEGLFALLRKMHCLKDVFGFNLKSLPLLIVSFKEIVETLNIKIFLKKFRLDQVIFFNSVDIMKPLWGTYCERNRISVIQCFYSMQVDPQPEFMQYVNNGHYALSTWKKFWVVDRYQQEFLKRLILDSSVEFEIVGIPHFNDSKYVLSVPVRHYISLFDFSLPNNYSHPAVMGFEHIYSLKNLEDFFTSILEIAKELNCVVLHKQKHRFNDRSSSQYKDLIQNLQKKYPNQYQSIKSEVAPEQMISKSFAVISVPVSSTAMVARSMNVPVVFFEPSFSFSKAHLGLREVPLVNSRVELKSWILSHINKNI